MIGFRRGLGIDRWWSRRRKTAGRRLRRPGLHYLQGNRRLPRGQEDPILREGLPGLFDVDGAEIDDHTV